LSTSVATATTDRVGSRDEPTHGESDARWLAVFVVAAIVSLIAGAAFFVRRRRRGNG
jgi:LPXTG-motif cell wall-anchored protein